MDNSIERINSTKLPKAVGPYSHAVYMNGQLFASGQLPIDPKTNKMPEDIVDQATQIFANIKELLHEKNMDFTDILKTTVYLSNLDYFAAVNEIYGNYFSEGNYPARSAFEVVRLPLGAKVEIEFIAGLA